MAIGVISLRFKHPANDLSFLSPLLDMPCSRSWVADSIRETPDGRALQGTNENSYWASRFKYSIEKGFKETFVAVVTKLSERENELREFRMSGGKIEIYLQLPGTINNGGTIESEYLETIGKMGVDLLIEVFPSPARSD